MAKQTTKPKRSDRERNHAAMLREAIARPGVREVMQFYQIFQAIDKGLYPYRQATKIPEIVKSTDHTYVGKPVWTGLQNA